MKKLALPLCLGLLVLTGCAHHYVMRLNNGMEITTASKPKLKDGIYQFKDARGQDHFVPEARVRELEPASAAAREDNAPPLKAEPPKKRKWYLLWLA